VPRGLQSTHMTTLLALLTQRVAVRAGTRALVSLSSKRLLFHFLQYYQTHDVFANVTYYCYYTITFIIQLSVLATFFSHFYFFITFVSIFFFIIQGYNHLKKCNNRYNDYNSNNIIHHTGNPDWW
jgi:hypothetical protein